MLVIFHTAQLETCHIPSTPLCHIPSFQVPFWLSPILVIYFTSVPVGIASSRKGTWKRGNRCCWL